MTTNSTLHSFLDLMYHKPCMASIVSCLPTMESRQSMCACCSSSLIPSSFLLEVFFQQWLETSPSSFWSFLQQTWPSLWHWVQTHTSDWYGYLSVSSSRWHFMEGYPDYDYFRQFIYHLCHNTTSVSAKLHCLWEQWDLQLGTHYPSPQYTVCFFCHATLPRHCLWSLHSSVGCCTRCHHQHINASVYTKEVSIPPLEDVVMLAA